MDLDLRTHTTVVEHCDRGGHAYATCSCGWSGRCRNDAETAASEGDAHLDAC